MQKLFFLLAFPLLLSISANSPSTEKNIHDLVKTNSIKCTPLTNGGYNTGSITLKISNLGSGQRVLIPLGTRFKSALGEEQDLVVPEDIIVAVPRNGEKEVKIDAYCVQQSNLSPGEGQTFSLAIEQDEKLLKVLNFMKGKGHEPSIIQEAIWAVTDGENVAGISMQNDNEKALREFVCDITGQENVWYDLDRDYQETETREIVTETKQVSGNIAYEVNETGDVVMQVTKEDGTVIRELGGGMPIANVGSYKFRFNMKVQGWERGVYFVQLKLEDNVFHKVAFEV